MLDILAHTTGKTIILANILVREKYWTHILETCLLKITTETTYWKHMEE